MAAIHLTVQKGNTRFLQWLLREKCDVNLKKENGDTPLHFATFVENVEAFRMLLESPDVDLASTNNDGLNILHYATLMERDAFVEIIVKREPRLINFQKSDGFSPLHMAVEKKCEKIVKILLQTESCNTELRTRAGQTPLMLAAAGGNLMILNYLVEAGADLKAFDMAGNTAAHTALHKCDQAHFYNVTVETVVSALRDQTECHGFVTACFLTKAGADIEQCNQAFQTPEDLCGNPQLQSVLRKFREMSLESRNQSSKLSAATSGHTSCRICSEDVYAILDPCGHSPMCYDCATVFFKACLECKVEIKNVKPVLDSLPMCKVCNEERSNVRYLPCGHTTACFVCSKRMKKCLTCEIPIREKKIIGPVPEETIPEQFACKICYERRSDAVFLCGHSTCSACAQPLRNCPFCREPIERVIRAYNN